LDFPVYRCDVDDRAGLVRVVGEVVNAGPTTVPRLEVRAVLLGTSGETRGENLSPLLEDLAPGEKREFGVNVRSHGGVSRVDLSGEVPEGK
jgi:hypothetical protein